MIYSFFFLQHLQTNYFSEITDVSVTPFQRLQKLQPVLGRRRCWDTRVAACRELCLSSCPSPLCGSLLRTALCLRGQGEVTLLPALVAFPLRLPHSGQGFSARGEVFVSSVVRCFCDKPAPNSSRFKVAFKCIISKMVSSFFFSLGV